MGTTVSIRGCPSTKAGAQRSRLRTLTDMVKRATDNQIPIHVIVFPGGYLRHSGSLCGLPFDERKRQLERAPFASGLTEAARLMHRKCKGSLVIVGIDTAPKGEPGDQLCVAWGHSGIVGIGRKVFPVKGYEASSFSVDPRDFSEKRRVVELPNGQRAILCSCYDGFGISGPKRFGKKIQRVHGYDTRTWRSGSRFEKAVEGWDRLCQMADIALIAIHTFSTGNSSMWQRHGIATASAALGGGAVLAAAHFQRRLPYDAQLLASKGVATRHLALGQQRQGEPATPIKKWSDGESRLLWFDLE